MIRLENLSKTFWVRGRAKVVADNITVTFPGRTGVALMGRNGAGKSSMMSMLAGSLAPDSGTIRSTGSISWPVGYRGSFHGEMTAAQNTRFIARVYGVDADALSDFVEDFAELGQHFHLPIRSYSSGMSARLSFAVSMGLEFDTYLIDEVTSVGDAAFRDKSHAMLMDRLQDSGAVMVSHSLGKLRDICSKGVILEKGRLWWYDDIDDAIAHHTETMKGRAGRDAAGDADDDPEGDD